MDFGEKARMKLEHWITHNEHHEEDYEAFAEQLEAAGMGESAGYVREMKALTAKSTACLKKALKAMA